MTTRVEELLDIGSIVADGDHMRDVEVNKPLDCELDLGELLVIDPNAVEDYKLKWVPYEAIPNICTW